MLIFPRRLRHHKQITVIIRLISSRGWQRLLGVALSLLSLSASAPLLLAREDHDHGPLADWTPAPYAEKSAHAPTPLPDRVVLTWNADPATTQAVTWRTDSSVRRALAELALANDNGRALVAIPHHATTTDFTSDLGEAHFHHVTFTHLTPNTLYAYRVGDGANWSEWFHFRTAKAEPAPFTFVYFGDAQNEVKMHWSRVFREAFREAPRAAFTLHAGDLINRANRDAEWGEWFGAPAWVHRTVPVIATPGNHEYDRINAGPESERLWTTADGSVLPVTIAFSPEGDPAKPTGYRVTATAGGIISLIQLNTAEKIVAVDEAFTRLTGYDPAGVIGEEADDGPLQDQRAVPGTRLLSRHWQPQFAFPTHGPAGLAETAYYIDYQGARIISLNSNELQEEQVGWLRNVLQTNPQRWTILTFHHPIVSPARGRDNPRLRELWKPVFDEFKVDLVLSGHDHTYARSGDTTAKVGTQNSPGGYQQLHDPAIGTVYVVSVSGPKMYDLTNVDWAVRSAEDTQLYQIITVSGNQLHYVARTVTNRLYDQFTLQKRPDRPNELIELLPPEARRAPVKE